MKIPKTFYLNGNRWTVKRRKNLKDDDGSECNGLTDTEVRVVYIDKSLEGTELTWVFWHEYCHALLYESKVTHNTGGLSDIVEEIICDSYADSQTKDKEITFKRRKRQ